MYFKGLPDKISIPEDYFILANSADSDEYHIKRHLA